MTIKVKIKQDGHNDLVALCNRLQAQIAAMRPVVEMAVVWTPWVITGQEDGLRKAKNPNGDLVRAVDAYLAGGGK